MKHRPAGARQTAWAAAVLALAACAAPRPKPVVPPPAPPPLDASYDWHVLLIAPFGSVLKDVPTPVHEVLLFHEDAPHPAADDLECYAPNQTPPRFVARTPFEYVLCFKHGHLSRVEAAVRLPQDQAAQIFADACGLWLGRAQAPSAQGCEGADRGMAFVGRLDSEPDAPPQLTIQIEPSDLKSDREPDR
jgi:hypothetical protein